MSIRGALAEDIPELLALGRRFFDESNFSHLTYAPERLAEVLGIALTDEGDIFVAEVDGQIAGGIVVFYARSFTEEPVAQLFQVFIAPEHRNSGIGGALFASAIAAAVRHECRLFYVASTGGFLDDGANNAKMVRLLSSHGFKEVGAFMRMEL